MVNEDILNKVKTGLRISHNALDGDIWDNITACVEDLRSVGVLDSCLDLTQDPPPLILTAIKHYCKTAYTNDPTQAARYQECYNNLKACLKMAEGYGYKEAGAGE